MKQKEFSLRLVCFLLCGILIISVAQRVKEERKSKTNAVTVSSEVKELLKENGISNYKIKNVSCSYKMKRKSLKKQNITKKVEEKIQNELEQDKSLEEIKKRKKVRKGDYVCIRITIESKCVENEKVVICVGKGVYNSKIESEIIGKKKGTLFYTYVKIDNKREKVYVEIKSINKLVLPKLTKKYVKKLGYNSIKEYRSEIKKRILIEDKEKIEEKEEKKVFEDLRSKSNISISKNQIAKYALENYVNNDKNMARSLKIDFKEYVKQTYQMSMKIYYSSTYKKAENALKDIIIMGVICNVKKLKADNLSYEKMKEQVMKYFIE